MSAICHILSWSAPEYIQARLPGNYLSQDCRGKLRPLEELDGDLAGYYAHLLGIGLAEELAEDALLLGREVERGVWQPSAFALQQWARGVDSLRSMDPEGSAMVFR